MSHETYQPDWNRYHERARNGPCFICGIVARDPAFRAHVFYESRDAIAFLDKYPRVFGYSQVAPREHRVHVTGSFSLQQYLELQTTVYKIAETIRQEVGAARVYLQSLGSNEGNAHVHWHVVPLPHGVPYHRQQLAIRDERVLSIPDEHCAELAARLHTRLAAYCGQASPERP